MNNKIIAAIVNSAKIEDVKRLLTLFIENLSSDDYNNVKTNHVLELLLGITKEVNITQINIDYIKEHLDLLFYKPEDYIVKNLKVEYIDNINGQVIIRGEYIEKINEDSDMPYNNRTYYVSYLDNPLILK